MKILVINGSPKGNNSNTMKITNRFLEGLNSIGKNEINIISVKEKNINHCLGCFSCWTKTPGKCVINDDMNDFINKYIESDLIIWSFPLYYFGMPSKVKAFMDRLLPLNLPYMNKEEKNGASHVARYDLKNKKYLLISTCGFHSRENNYEGLIKQFEILCGENLETIICTEGELLKVEELRGITNKYLENVYEGAREYYENEKISKSTKERLNELFFSPEIYIEMANNSWEINGASENSKAENLLKQMKLLYNSNEFEGNEKIVIEFKFSDIEEAYQLILDNEKCELIKENFFKYTTKITVSFKLWEDISKGNEKGDEALMNGKYNVEGDMNVMMKFSSYFGRNSEEKINKIDHELKTNMTLFFIPWIGFWTLINFNNIIAGILAIITVGIIPLLTNKYKLTIYDKLSILFSTIFGTLALINYETTYLYGLSFILVGTIWLISTFFKYPLTAEYSINQFEDKKMKDNVIFIKTNKILTVLWVVVYYLMGVLSFLNFHGVEKLILNNLLPLGMLWFTNYFAKEYPKHLMSKNIKMENTI
jgi:multimeric flavodoxin WrbA/putative sterol carrier protein